MRQTRGFFAVSQCSRLLLTTRLCTLGPWHCSVLHPCVVCLFRQYEENPNLDPGCVRMVRRIAWSAPKRPGGCCSRVSLDVSSQSHDKKDSHDVMGKLELLPRIRIPNAISRCRVYQECCHLTRGAAVSLDRWLDNGSAAAGPTATPEDESLTFT